MDSVDAMFDEDLSDGNHLTVTLGLDEGGVASEASVFFRVEEE